jgi:hypothetical protein
MTLFFVGRCVATAPKHPPVDVRFTPKSDQMLHCREMTLWAMNGLMHCSKLGRDSR